MKIGRRTKTYTQTQVDTAVSKAKSESINSVYKNLGFESESDMQEFIDKYTYYVGIEGRCFQ